LLTIFVRNWYRALNEAAKHNDETCAESNKIVIGTTFAFTLPLLKSQVVQVNNKNSCIIVIILEVMLGEKKRMKPESYDPAVLNWDSMIDKRARTKDGKPLGYMRPTMKNLYVFYLRGPGSIEFQSWM
jgi:hypothetical protein